MKKLPLILLVLIVIGCAKHSNQPSVDQTLVNKLMEDRDPDGLPLWTADTIKKTNPELVFLMDTLYRHILTEDFQSEGMNGEREWMEAYRLQLADYYKRNNLGPDSLSIFDKVDSVILAADRLWQLNDDYSTMGMLVHNQARFMRLKLQEYNNYARLLEMCGNEKQKRALEDEFSAWIQVDTITRNVLSNLTSVACYGGSACGPIISSGINDIVDAHNYLYLKDLAALTYSPVQAQDYGVLDESGGQLLLNVSKTTYEGLSYMLDEFNDDFIQPTVDSLYNESKISIEKLSPAISNWISKRREWSNIGTDYTERQLNRNSGELLVRLSSIISSIQ